jgi:ArsR family transcriptional regulator, arsenate/arsenite/antimonite-responsive transcriptional repressor
MMRPVLNLTKAFADESRLRLLLALKGGELCVCQLTELLGLAPSTVSKHLSILAQAGLVCSRKEGRWIYYSLIREPGSLTGDAIEWLEKGLARDHRILHDRRALKQILKEDPSELCKRQCLK